MQICSDGIWWPCVLHGCLLSAYWAVHPLGGLFMSTLCGEIAAGPEWWCPAGHQLEMFDGFRAPGWAENVNACAWTGPFGSTVRSVLVCSDEGGAGLFGAKADDCASRREKKCWRITRHPMKNPGARRLPTALVPYRMPHQVSTNDILWSMDAMQLREVGTLAV